MLQRLAQPQSVFDIARRAAGNDFHAVGGGVHHQPVQRGQAQRANQRLRKQQDGQTGQRDFEYRAASQSFQHDLNRLATHEAEAPQSIYTRATMVFTINANCIFFYTLTFFHRRHVHARQVAT
ncbi:hypothetical protein D9M69_696550 [compost metagenome]